MPTPTKIWTVPVAAQQDPAVPITSSWGNNVKDNEQFLMEWLGADYLAEATQNHNHDGVNSAKVDVLEGLMPNGSFQLVSAGLPIGWTATEFTGGTVASSTAVNKHGDTVLAITSTVLANGGGSAIPDEYKAVTDNKEYGFEIYRWASVANVSCRCELIWYDAAQAQISSTTLFTDTNTALAASLYSGNVTSPANARFVRVKPTGGVPATGAAVGTVYFDGGVLDPAVTLIAANAITATEIAAGAVGASEIAAGAVHTSELNTSTASTSTAANVLLFTMTGGMYVFSPQYKTSSSQVYFCGGYSTVTPFHGPATTGSTSYITANVIGRSSGTGYCQWRYVAASPPHDMGDGDIPLFAFAIIDNTSGDVDSIAIAEEPVWLASGPTNAMPDFWRKDKKFKVAKDVPASFAALSDVERMIAISELPDVEVEITNEMVHADMDLIPHPFQGNDLSGKTVVMLDPVSEAVRQLSKLDKSGEDVHSIIRDKYIKIGNTGLNRVTPAGLLIPETTWKKAA